jgi:hypothetical protein
LQKMGIDCIWIKQILFALINDPTSLQVLVLLQIHRLRPQIVNQRINLPKKSSFIQLKSKSQGPKAASEHYR